MCILDRCRSGRRSGATEILSALASAGFVIAVALVTTHADDAVAAPPAAAGAAADKADKAAAPTAEIDAQSQKVLDRAAEVALGPFAKDRSLKAIRMTGRMVMPGQGINAELSMLLDAEGRQAMQVEIPGLGLMRSGITKDLGWSFNEMTGPVVMSDAERTQARRQSDLYAPLKWSERATKITYGGEAEVELPDGTKRPTHKLVMTSRDTGEEEIHHFDREHGWEVRAELMQMMPGAGRIPLVTTYLDHRDVKGMKMPYRTVVSVGPQVQEIVIESIEVNPTIEDGAFAVPDEVKQVAGR